MKTLIAPASQASLLGELPQPAIKTIVRERIHTFAFRLTYAVVRSVVRQLFDKVSFNNSNGSLGR